MTETSMLAAVRAAASTELTPAADAASQTQEQPMADKTQGAAAHPAVEAKPATAAELTAAFPELVASIRGDAATAERARILGIEKVFGPRKGHEDLSARLKADGKTTPEQAALALVEADNARIEAQGAAIRGVDADVKVPAAPASDRPAESVAQTPDGWKAEFEKAAEDSDLRRDFASAESYVAYRQGLASGRIRVLKTKSA